MMGKLFERIEADRNVFLKNRDGIALATCKVIIGEIHRDPNKDRSDKNVLKILKSLRKMTLKSPIDDPLLVNMIDNYLPDFISDIDVVQWVKDNNTYDDIVEMDKRAYSIIGKAKQHYKDNEINSGCVKNFIDDVLANGDTAYECGGVIEPYELKVDIDVMSELFDATQIRRKGVHINETFD
jgi:hypothetical protein